MALELAASDYAVVDMVMRVPGLLCDPRLAYDCASFAALYAVMSVCDDGLEARRDYDAFAHPQISSSADVVHHADRDCLDALHGFYVWAGAEVGKAQGRRFA